MKYIYVRCPEYDTLESNKYTVAGTLHKCNGGDGYWSDCDRGGCQNNAFYVDSSMFCPEDRYHISFDLNSNCATTIGILGEVVNYFTFLILFLKGKEPF